MSNLGGFIHHTRSAKNASICCIHASATCQQCVSAMCDSNVGNMLQCLLQGVCSVTAVCCSVLQCVVVYCSVSVVCCSVYHQSGGLHTPRQLWLMPHFPPPQIPAFLFCIHYKRSTKAIVIILAPKKKCQHLWKEMLACGALVVYVYTHTPQTTPTSIRAGRQSEAVRAQVCVCVCNLYKFLYQVS